MIENNEVSRFRELEDYIFCDFDMSDGSATVLKQFAFQKVSSQCWCTLG